MRKQVLRVGKGVLAGLLASQLAGIVCTLVLLAVDVVWPGELVQFPGLISFHRQHAFEPVAMLTVMFLGALGGFRWSWIRTRPDDCFTS